MITAASASPTLSLVIRAPEALDVLAALRLGIKELKAEVAGLGVGFGSASTAGVAKLEAQVNELTAALATSRLELSQIQQKMEATSASGVKALQVEKQAILEKNRVARDEARKTADAEEAAQLRKLTAAETALAKLGRLQITSVAPNAKNRLSGDSLTNLEDELGTNRALGARRAAEQAQQVALQRLVEADYVRAHAEAVAENAAIDRAAAARKSAEQAQQLAQHRLNEAAYVRAHAEAVAENAAIDKAAQAGRAIQNNTNIMREAHSAARGLAGGLGALWLTYGSTVPLLAGFAIAASLRESVKAGSEFQYQMEFTRAIIDETSEHAKSAGEEFKKLAVNSQFSAVEIAKGSRVLGQAGFDTFRDIVSTLPSVLKLATVGELEVGNAAEIAAGNMNAFGLTVNEIPNIVNSLAKAAVLSQTNIKEMGEALKQVGPMAQQAGIGINDINALLSVLATRNIRGQAAGTSLANVFRELISPTAKGADALRRIGVDGIDPVTGKLKQAVPLMQEFLGVFKQFDPQSQAILVNEIFNNRASKGFVTALAEATTRLPEFRTEIGKAYKEANFLDSVMTKLGDTFRFQSKEALNALQVAFIDAFEGSGKELTKLAKQAKDLFTDKEFISFITSTVRGFATMAEWILKVADGLAKVWALMKALKELQETDASTAGNPNTFFVTMERALELLIKKARGALGSYADDTIAKAAAKNGAPALSAEAQKRIDDAAAWEARGAAEMQRQQKVLAEGQQGTLVFKPPSKTIGAEKSDILSQVNFETKAIEQAARYTKEIYDKQRQSQLITEEDFQDKLELLERDKITKLQTITRLGLDQLIKLEREASNEIFGLKREEASAYDKAASAEAASASNAQDLKQQAAEKSAKLAEANANQIRIRTAQRELKDRQTQLAEEARHQVALGKVTKDGKEKALRDASLTNLYKLSQDADEKRRKEAEAYAQSLLPERDQVAVKAILDVQAQFYSRIADLQRDIAKAKEDANGSDTYRLSNLQAELTITQRLRAEKERQAKAQALAQYDDSRNAGRGVKNALQAYKDAATNDAANAARAVTNIFKAAEDALLNFFTTGKFGFRDFATFIVKELLRIQIAKALAGVATTLIPFSSGIGKAVTGGYVGASHSGGIVGIEHSFSRELPRFHGGGIVGDEQMVIARKKEGVFTPAQMRALAPVGSGGNYVINITVNNNGTSAPDADVSGGPQGLAQALRGVVVEELVRQQRPGGQLAGMRTS